jgi:hypothetical protein
MGGNCGAEVGVVLNGVMDDTISPGGESTLLGEQLVKTNTLESKKAIRTEVFRLNFVKRRTTCNIRITPKAGQQEQIIAD